MVPTSAFYSHNVEVIDLPECLSISSYAFNLYQYDYSAPAPVLSYLSLPKVQYIANYAFRNNGASNLQQSDISFPECLSIGSGAMFANISAITSIYLPKVRYVGSDAFFNCRNVEELDLPEVISCGGFGADAYGLGSAGLKRASLPKCTTLFGAFKYQSNLSEVYAPLVSTLNGYNFTQCAKLSSLVIDFSHLKYISNYDFAQTTIFNNFDSCPDLE